MTIVIHWRHEDLRASSGLIGSIVSDSGATYTPGVSEKRGGSSTYYHSDIKNSVEQTTSSQTISASQQYDAFGNQVSLSGTWNGPFAYGGRFGYQSDGDYGLKLLGHRYYDSTTGRFLSRDPIRDGRNWYVYCYNNPAVNADPTGLATAAFSGRYFKIFNDRGEEILRVPATSGVPGSSRQDQAIKGRGPIPEGTYRINPELITVRTWNPLKAWLIESYFFSTDDWGNFRVPVQPVRVDVFGRDGFFIHGGGRPGSAGCIDVGTEDRRVFDTIRRLPKGIRLVVDYSSWHGTTPSPAPDAVVGEERQSPNGPKRQPSGRFFEL